MPGFYDHINVLPGSIQVARGEVTLPSGPADHILQTRWVSIVDIVSDPENPQADFGDSLQISYVKSTAIAWAVTLDNDGFWAGSNRAGFFVDVIQNQTGVAPVAFRGDIISRARLWIGHNTKGFNLYQYHGIVPVNALMMAVRFLNWTGDEIKFNYSVFAVPWSNQ